MKRVFLIAFLLLSITSFSFYYFSNPTRPSINPSNKISSNKIYQTALAFAAETTWVYDAAYYRIAYPNGDVPSGGACTDVIIRVLRKNGMDLQQLIHEDMRAHFSVYPKRWGLTKPDPNIDHRRVPNIMTYFSRQHYDLPITQQLKDYKPGDIIAWELSPGIPHIGILLDGETVFHNIGPVSNIEKGFLFSKKIIGHYRISHL